jgi:hypothetical protein
MSVFWVVVPCSLVEVYQRSRGPCCLHCQVDESTHRPDDGDSPEDSHLLNSYWIACDLQTTIRYSFFEYHNLHISVSISSCSCYEFTQKL